MLLIEPVTDSRDPCSPASHNASAARTAMSGSPFSWVMSPSIAVFGDGSLAALGSGGSNRIRTAILQVLSNLIDFAMPVEEAVPAPRLHFEDGVLNIEGGFDPETCEKLRATLDPAPRDVINWPPHNLFFGGVHAATRRADGRWHAAGDPRRGGAAVLP